MHVPINVKSPNNISKWQMGFNSAFEGLIKRNLSTDFLKNTQIKFLLKSVQREPSFSVRTDGHDEANSRFSQFYERA
jgi:hypothetical protein